MQWRPAADADWSAASEVVTADTNYTISGLTNGVEYAVRVIAVNSVGDSEPSATVTATPMGPALELLNDTGVTGLPPGDHPTNLTLDVAVWPPTLTWTLPGDGRTYTRQEVWRRIIGTEGADWIKTDVATDATSWEDNNPVEAGTDYRYRIRIRAEDGSHTLSPKLDVRVLRIP